MTREEAIERFENVKANALVQKASGVSVYWQNEIDGTVEAIDMAIEALQADTVSREVYDKRTQADEEIIDSYREKLANCHKEILRLLDFNDITESPNDVVKTKDDVIKKPRTVRYKLHKPIEYVSIEVDEEEEITHIGHYTAYGERREP